MAGFIQLGPKSVKSGSDTCTVRVNSADPLCGHLDQKIVAGTNISITQVAGSSGNALQIAASGGSGAGYSEIMRVLYPETVDTMGKEDADGHWDSIYYNELGTARACGLNLIGYDYVANGYQATYMMASTRVFHRAELNMSGQFRLLAAAMLGYYDASTPYEATCYVDVLYRTNTNLGNVVRVADGLVVTGTSGNEMQDFIIDFDVPGDIADLSALMVAVIPYDSYVASPPSQGTVRANEFQLGLPSIIIPYA